MSGTIINNYGIGDVNFDNLMLTTDAQRIGYHSLTLTEFDTNTVPEIAAGSKIEVNGSLYEFDSNESISGSPSDGDVYIYLSETKGTASGATTDATGYAIGTTTITLASAGTGTIIVGDRVTFAGDTVKYVVMSGDSDVSNGGTITIASPGLLTAIPSSTTAITVYTGAVEANFTNVAPTWSDSKQGWYGTGGSSNYRYVNYVMDKSGSNYSEKQEIPFDKISNFKVNDEGDIECIDIVANELICWDYEEAAASTQIYTYTSGGTSTEDFYIKKPISAYFSVSGASLATLGIYQNGSGRQVSSPGASSTEYGLFLTPGKYYIFVNAGTTGTLYCTGVYGSDSITVSEITETA